MNIFKDIADGAKEIFHDLTIPDEIEDLPCEFCGGKGTLPEDYGPDDRRIIKCPECSVVDEYENVKDTD